MNVYFRHILACRFLHFHLILHIFFRILIWFYLEWPKPYLKNGADGVDRQVELAPKLPQAFEEATISTNIRWIYGRARWISHLKASMCVAKQSASLRLMNVLVLTEKFFEFTKKTINFNIILIAFIPKNLLLLLRFKIISGFLWIQVVLFLLFCSILSGNRKSNWICQIFNVDHKGQYLTL